MKTYPLAIEEPLCEGDGYYSKGHHDPAAFIAALNAELGEDGELFWKNSDPYPEWAAEAVKHEYWRCGQDCFSVSEEYGWSVYPYTSPGRGRFPVTRLYVDDYLRLAKKRRGVEDA
jgi:hypothetical protein